MRVKANAGEVLREAVSGNLQLLITGHKHSPTAWHLENLLVVNAGTASTTSTRANSDPGVLIVRLDRDNLVVEEHSTAKQRCRILATASQAL